MIYFKHDTKFVLHIIFLLAVLEASHSNEELTYLFQ